MKVAELVAAFQRFATPRNETDAAGPESLPLAQSLKAPATTPEPLPAPAPLSETEDQISVIPEAVFTFAASRFDPQRITRPEIEALADTLRNGGAISGRDRTILTSLPQDQLQSALFDNGAAEPTNLVADFQGRLAVDLAKSNIRAVEEDTRALAILGRLAGIREELGA